MMMVNQVLVQPGARQMQSSKMYCPVNLNRSLEFLFAIRRREILMTDFGLCLYLFFSICSVFS